MGTSQSLIDRIISGGERNLFVLSVSFEERCLKLAKILKESHCNHGKNRFISIILTDENVTPLSIVRRKEIKDEIRNLIGPEFKTPEEAIKNIEEEITKTGEDYIGPNVIVDASGLPRRLIYKILDLISKYRKTFKCVYLTYNHPREYLLGEFELISPIMPLHFDSPTIYGREKFLLCIFPGFNTSETSTAICRFVNPNLQEQKIRIQWFFVHPGSQYSFYERALCEHSVFIEHMRGISQDVKLCSMNDFRQIGHEIISLAHQLDSDELLVLIGLGPRILSVPIFLTAKVLQTLNTNVNILVPIPLVYRSIRSKGEGRILDVWDLEEEYASIENIARRQ